MKVLIAEDNKVQRKFLEELLKKLEYEVVSCEDGDTAWKILNQEDAPMLALLDWMMPGLQGVELCRKLREEKERSLTYSIIMTAKEGREDMLFALDAGADDYLVKPLNPQQLEFRLSIAAKVLNARKAMGETEAVLDRYVHHVEEIAQERANQLVHADRLTSIGAMATGVAHEINNPIGYVTVSLETMELYWQSISGFIETLEHTAPQTDRSLKIALERMPQNIKRIRNGVDKVGRIVRGLKNFGRDSSEERTMCSIKDCVEEALEICQSAVSKNTEIAILESESLPMVPINRQKIEQVLVNIVVNADHAMENKRDGKVKISLKPHGDSIELTIEDNGPGIPEDKLETIWKPFFTTKAHGKGTGLGLAISKGIIQEHGGDIHVKNKPDGGAMFVITLPTNENKISS